MNVTNFHAHPRTAEARAILVTLHLHVKPVMIDGKAVWSIDLRDAAGGAAALQAARNAGGGDTDQGTAAFLRMSGLTLSQMLALDADELMRCLMVALTLAEVASAIANEG
ncbi:MAG: hypothetical protein J0I54_12180 [Bosea sp.]|uniref:hypothetical protein n=1 Tax=unclassified Bosea (in: a-proteobacteria) TaxID=2653178 RepID=UPI000969183E|nr:MULTISPECIES: hypothetical protein [unclassified Bosea (in: a-proteobacteria)]MBN9457377.1 hypothetical protein [Bosea sp. (in: a-proteobacteria)]OJV09637.1 MAG: hypothetical protein BGO20_02935 [Bosea sp. 67-29]